MSEPKAMSAEEIVRAAWPAKADYCGTPSQPVRIFTAQGVESFGTWSASLAFTEQRQREIAQLEEQIEYLMRQCPPPTHLRNTIIKRLQAIRDDLKRGMR